LGKSVNESLVLHTLSDKRCEIKAHIGSLERDLEPARRWLTS
jgi:hypothetical protein